MELTPQQKTELGQIIDDMDCPKEFVCYMSGFMMVGKTRFSIEAGLLECLEENGQFCRFALSSVDGVFCRCPLRNYLAIKLRL